MQQEIFNQLNSFNQTAYEATRQLADINLRAYEKIVQQQFELTGMCFDAAIKQMDALRETKDVGAYLRAQADMFRGCAEKALAASKENMDVLAAVRGEYNDWLEKGLATATSNLNLTTPKKAA